MATTTASRRNFLAAGTTGVVSGLAAATGLVATRAEAATSPACGGMSRERYMQYVTMFNANDPGYFKFYHDDVALELGTQVIRTPQGIRDFYGEVKAHIKETVQVSHFVSDATGIAAELPTEFKVYKDWGNGGFFQRPLKVGEVLRVVSLGLYWVEDGKFRRIKAARQKLVNDWRMEG